MAAWHLIIRGSVQGVGFRDALCEQARVRGITGWVRNRGDGSVEALLLGPIEDVRAVHAWSLKGPPLARVAEVAVESVPLPDRPYPRFVRLPSSSG